VRRKEIRKEKEKKWVVCEMKGGRRKERRKERKVGSDWCQLLYI
jgi:hypothetical protein